MAQSLCVYLPTSMLVRCVSSAFIAAGPRCGILRVILMSVNSTLRRAAFLPTQSIQDLSEVTYSHVFICRLVQSSIMESVFHFQLK
ncbi:hypothetical protein GALMADRAFT_1051404 [Galerina marginata CBS 339.88]|uniref:Uncharacterized protein n=1 Tax=Galerina marginata (strain CBS 339.88) TaxID=685588 RepID=A0A067SK50_GALM3|nr:hypothetical protein GALMADRAFT_1051404 [Galerina marginata CBS 339.88]